MGIQNTNSNAIAEKIKDDISFQQRSLADDQARIDALEKIFRLVQEGDWDGIVDTIANQADATGAHTLISRSALRGNKPFLSAFIAHVVPEAEDVSPNSNAVEFTVNSIKGEFNFCAPFTFRLDAPYSFRQPLESYWQTIHHFDRKRMEALDADWQHLCSEGLINASFSYTGDKKSNDQTREFLLRSGIMLEKAGRMPYYSGHAFLGIRKFMRKMNPAKYVWKEGTYPVSCQTKFAEACNSVSYVAKMREDVEQLVAKMEAWDEAAALLSECASRSGFSCQFPDSSEWEHAPKSKKESILKEYTAFLDDSEKFLEMWNNESEMYKAHRDWRAEKK